MEMLKKRIRIYPFSYMHIHEHNTRHSPPQIEKAEGKFKKIQNKLFQKKTRRETVNSSQTFT